MQRPKSNDELRPITIEPMNPNAVATAKTRYKARMLAFSSPLSPSLELSCVELFDKATRAAGEHCIAVEI